MEASFPARPGDKIVVDWAAKPEDGCGPACGSLVYVGARGTPASAAWAAVPGTPELNGWAQYEYMTVVPPDANPGGSIDVGFGVNTQGPLAPTALGIDCVRISVETGTN